MSIQLTLGGHSFSVNTLPAQLTEQADEVEFVVLTHKTLLVPCEEFDEDIAEKYLQLAGLACTPSETTVWSAPRNGIIAVMAVSAACITLLQDKFGCKATFSSPLLRQENDSVATVSLYYTGDLLYIKVWDSALRFAEVVPTPTEADVIYYIERLSHEFLFTAFTARISGDGCKLLVKSLRNYFPRMICE